MWNQDKDCLGYQSEKVELSIWHWVWGFECPTIWLQIEVLEYDRVDRCNSNTHRILSASLPAANLTQSGKVLDNLSVEGGNLMWQSFLVKKSDFWRTAIQQLRLTTHNLTQWRGVRWSESVAGGNRIWIWQDFNTMQTKILKDCNPTPDNPTLWRGVRWSERVAGGNRITSHATQTPLTLCWSCT